MQVFQATQPARLLRGMVGKHGRPSAETRTTLLERRCDDLISERRANLVEIRRLNDEIKRLQEEKRKHEEAFTAIATGRHIPINGIIEIVARFYRVRADEIVSEHRYGYLIKPRQIAAYLAADITGRSSVVIGRAMHRDHTSILYSMKEGRKKANANEGSKKELEILRLQIANAYPRPT